MRHYDVVVVGGGIHGVGVAQAAAAAGHSVVVIEKSALAAGTSSKSSKLIHGGLRYLESHAWSLVRESLRERELLMRLAPELVRPRTFFLPIYASTRRSPWVVRAGLSLYSALAGCHPSTWFRSVPRPEWPDLDGLTLDGLRNVFAYMDAQTDDAALTRAVMASAETLGAELLCPAEFVHAQRESVGYTVAYRSHPGGSEQSLRGATLVNAAGAWANAVLERIEPRPPAFPVALVQGTHLELAGPIQKGCYYVEMADGRAVFVLPWKGHTLLGTTEHVYQGDPAAARPLAEETDYLLRGWQHFFPRRAVEVQAAWTGLRVLPAGKGSAFSRSRETQLPGDDGEPPRLVSIFGGKLTGYRATAEKVLRRLRLALPATRARADTKALPLSPVAEPT